MEMVLTDDRLMTPRQTADFLGLSESTLAKKRLTKEGPPYIKMGGTVRYRRSDLETFVERSVRRSTHKHDGVVAEAAR